MTEQLSFSLQPHIGSTDSPGPLCFRFELRLQLLPDSAPSFTGVCHNMGAQELVSSNQCSMEKVMAPHSMPGKSMDGGAC